MKIELANKFDIPSIIEMLKHYRSATPVKQFEMCDDEEYISKLLTHILMGRGLLLVARTETKIVGMLLSFIDQSIWDNNLLVLKELAYWVEPEHRGTSAGYRLITKYNELAQELHDQGRINMWTISKMTNSPDLDYGRFGYRKIEETYMMGDF